MAAQFGCSDDSEADTPAAAKDAAVDADDDVQVVDGGGKCTFDKDCPALAEPCQKNVCDPELGCIAKVRPEGSICAHSNPCVEGGVCNKVAKCEGEAVVVCDDGDPCTADSCDAAAAGACVTVPVADSPPTGCSDGDKCTGGDKCVGGACQAGTNDVCGCKVDADCDKDEDGDACNGTLYCDVGASPPKCKINPASVVECKEEGDVCEAAVCDPKDGSCGLQNKADGALCEDDDPCTENTACADGVCEGGKYLCTCLKDEDCVDQDNGDLCDGVMFCNMSVGKCQLNPATIVNCQTVDDSQCARNVCFKKTGECKLTNMGQLKACAAGEGCAYKPLPEGEEPTVAPCDDGNLCTPAETCKDGKCDPGLNTCSCKADADCLDKDDGDLCNGTMWCNKAAKDKDGKPASMCEVNPATLINCQSVDDTQCSKHQCDPKDGGCKLKPIQDDIQCDADGSICTPYDFCKEGKCEVGKNICTCGGDDECAKFEDGDLCNGTMFCDKQAKDDKGKPAPVCQIDPKTVVGCPSVDNTECKKNLCQPKLGVCKMAFLQTGALCTDGVPCTQGDACENGSCVPGPDICDCGKDSDCADKEDGDVCNGTLYCAKATMPWKCKVNPATQIKCPSVDDNYCQVNSCHPKTGQCGLVYKHIDEPCDDGDPCTKLTICKAGACTDPDAGNAKKCDDGNVCTDDGCDAKIGCVNAPSAAKCDDGNACTEGDACDKGKCVSGKTVDCDDSNVCTTEVCHKIAGCIKYPNSDGCSDGDVCTEGDVCKTSKCVSGPPKDCDDNNPCTYDGCNTGTGKCANESNAAKACDDGVSAPRTPAIPSWAANTCPSPAPATMGSPAPRTHASSAAAAAIRSCTAPARTTTSASRPPVTSSRAARPSPWPRGWAASTTIPAPSATPARPARASAGRRRRPAVWTASNAPAKRTASAAMTRRPARWARSASIRSAVRRWI